MPLSVTELVARLKLAVEAGTGEAVVEGEVGSCKTAASGHVYFTLKDASSQVQCVLYRFQAAACRVFLREGVQVELCGRATVWEGRGSLQFIVSGVKEAGVGSLQQRFEALKAKLKSEGLFDASRKREIPRFPGSVGIITSPVGAVIQDMRHRLSERAPWMQAYLLPVQVQGRGAELGLAEAVRRWGRAEDYGLPTVDYLIVARGGGSLEDLWCFNEEVLARAIAACPVPVVSAVGHETDFTIADFVADLRAPTPTAAIELTTPEKARLAVDLRQAEVALRRALDRAFRTAELRLRVAERGRLREPLMLLAPFAQKLDVLAQELHASASMKLRDAENRLGLLASNISPLSVLREVRSLKERTESQRQSLLAAARVRVREFSVRTEAMETRIEALNPQKALSRGFALVRTADGRLARDAAKLSPGERLDVTLASGSVRVEVVGEEEQLSLF